MPGTFGIILIYIIFFIIIFYCVIIFLETKSATEKTKALVVLFASSGVLFAVTLILISKSLEIKHKSKTYYQQTLRDLKECEITGNTFFQRKDIGSEIVKSKILTDFIKQNIQSLTAQRTELLRKIDKLEKDLESVKDCEKCARILKNKIDSLKEELLKTEKNIKALKDAQKRLTDIVKKLKIIKTNNLPFESGYKRQIEKTFKSAENLIDFKRIPLYLKLKELQKFNLCKIGVGKDKEMYRFYYQNCQREAGFRPQGICIDVLDEMEKIENNKIKTLRKIKRYYLERDYFDD